MRGQITAARLYAQSLAGVSAATRAAKRAFAVTSRALRGATSAVLEPVELLLLSASSRERIHATATFSLIFLFAVTSLDFLIGGGPEFGAPARAAQQQSVVHQSPSPAQRAVAPPRSAPAEEIRPTQLASQFAVATDANVVAVSQRFGTPLLSDAFELIESLVEPGVGGAQANEAGQAGLDGPGDVEIATAATADAAASETVDPRKRGRVKDEHAARGDAGQG